MHSAVSGRQEARASARLRGRESKPAAAMIIPSTPNRSKRSWHTCPQFRGYEIKIVVVSPLLLRRTDNTTRRLYDVCAVL